MEYLYYSYLFSGMYYKAEEYGKNLPDALKTKLGINTDTKIKSVYLEGGKTWNTNFGELNNDQFNDYDIKRLGEKRIYEKNIYGNLSLVHKFSDKKMIHSYSYLDFSKYYYASEVTLGDTSYHNSLKQHQYYIGLISEKKNGFMFYPSLHILMMKKDEMVYYPPQSTFPPYPSYTIENSREFELVGSVVIGKRYSNVNVSGLLAISNLNKMNNTQLEGEISWYPLSNLNLYSTTRAIGLFHSLTTFTGSGQGSGGGGRVTEKTRSFVIHQAVGMRLYKVWLEPFITYGNMSNFIENKGYTVYNDMDPIKRKMGVNIIVPIGKFKWTIRYVNLQKEGGIRYTLPLAEEEQVSYIYNNNTIISSFSLNF
jgi:hypothetical protein